MRGSRQLFEGDDQVMVPRPVPSWPGKTSPCSDQRSFALHVGSALLPGGHFVDDVTVLVEGESIAEVAIGAEAARLDHASIVEEPESTLVPGLIDTHVHLTFKGGPDPQADMERASDVLLAMRAANSAQLALVQGVTTVADCGARGRIVIELRDAVERGEVIGPRILAAGAPVTTTAGHCAWLGGCADLTGEVVREARRQIAAGADFLKLMLTGGNSTPGSNPYMMQYPEEAVVAIAAEARRLGKPLVVHAHSRSALALAARAGASVIAHATCWGDEGIGLDEDTLNALGTARVAIDPTITVGMPMGAAGDARPRQRERVREEMLPIFAEMHRHGIPLLGGTDSGVANVEHGSGPRAVLSLLREVGLTLEEALAAATNRAAAAFGIANVTGSIEPGLAADLVLVDGGLRANPALLLLPPRVWVRGRLAAINGMLLTQETEEVSLPGGQRRVGQGHTGRVAGEGEPI